MDLIGEVRGHLSEKQTFYQSHEKREAVPSKVWMGASSRGTEARLLRWNRNRETRVAGTGRLTNAGRRVEFSEAKW